MTPQALQRVLVRMLYDPSLVTAIYSGEVPDGISPAQVALIRQTPRGAWGHDPYRPSRTLQALLEEYPASAALLGPGPLHAFFRDPEFHHAIQNRRFLAVAFGEWLTPKVGAIARLERSIAALRRRQLPGLSAEEVVCAPSALPVTLDGGTLAAWQALLGRLGPAPVQTIAAKRFRPLPRPVLDSTAPEHWLLERAASGEIGLSGGSAGLCGLLEAALHPRTRDALHGVAGSLGADPGEEDTVLDGLVDAGLLIAGPR